MPALFTNTSICPSESSVALMAALTCAWSVTSSLRIKAAPFFSKSLIVSGLRAVTTTQYPRANAHSAIWRPKPVEHPVINHTGFSISAFFSIVVVIFCNPQWLVIRVKYSQARIIICLCSPLLGNVLHNLI